MARCDKLSWMQRSAIMAIIRDIGTRLTFSLLEKTAKLFAKAQKWHPHSFNSKKQLTQSKRVPVEDTCMRIHGIQYLHHWRRHKDRRTSCLMEIWGFSCYVAHREKVNSGALHVQPIVAGQDPKESWCNFRETGPRSNRGGGTSCS